MSGCEDNDWLTGEQDSTTSTKRIVGLQQGNLQSHKDEFINVETGERTEDKPARECHFLARLDH